MVSRTEAARLGYLSNNRKLYTSSNYRCTSVVLSAPSSGMPGHFRPRDFSAIARRCARGQSCSAFIIGVCIKIIGWMACSALPGLASMAAHTQGSRTSLRSALPPWAALSRAFSAYSSVAPAVLSGRDRLRVFAAANRRRKHPSCRAWVRSS